MWQAHHGALEVDLINHRQRTFSYPGAGWGTITTFLGEDDNYFKPSIAGFPELPENQELRATWKCEGTGIFVMKYDGESWGSNFIYNPTALDPNLSVNKYNFTPSNNPKYVYRNYSELPYLLNISSQHMGEDPEGGGFAKEGDSIVVRHHRKGVFKITDSEIALELGNLFIDGKEIRFLPVNDSLLVGQNITLNQVLQTEPFQISDKAKLDFSLATSIINRPNLVGIIQNGDDVEFSIDVVDAQTKQNIVSLEKWSAIKNLPSNALLNKSYIFNMKGTRDVILRIELDLTGNIKGKESLVEMYYLDESSSFSKPSAPDNEKSIVNLIPAKFDLHQNYPNPFNPSTTITFDLPDDSPVHLEIFDITGRHIKTLVSEPMPAGSHQITWYGQDDLGNSVASGLYIYRIQASDFVQARKMLFVK
jgi:hypothetical protein